MTIRENHVRSRGVAPIAQSEEQWPSKQTTPAELSITSLSVPRFVNLPANATIRRRPAALHGRDNLPAVDGWNTPTGVAHFGVPDRRPVSAAVVRARAAAERERALDFVRSRRGEVYSAELATALECRIAHAKSLLIALERLGYLDSSWRPSEATGLGRRWYRLRVPA